MTSSHSRRYVLCCDRRTSTAPIIASHSSCRAISSNTRNMTDDMIRAIAKNGGTMQINFDCGYLSQRYDDASKPLEAEMHHKMQEALKIAAPAERDAAMEKILAESVGKLQPATLDDVVAQIDHAVKIGGHRARRDRHRLRRRQYAFLPELSSYDKFPALTRALLEKVYSAADIKKIYGGNLLRVMRAVEKRAQELRSTPAIETEFAKSTP